jgi:hypothetical protein
VRRATRPRRTTTLTRTDSPTAGQAPTSASAHKRDGLQSHSTSLLNQTIDLLLFYSLLIDHDRLLIIPINSVPATEGSREGARHGAVKTNGVPVRLVSPSAALHVPMLSAVISLACPARRAPPCYSLSVTRAPSPMRDVPTPLRLLHRSQVRSMNMLKQGSFSIKRPKNERRDITSIADKVHPHSGKANDEFLSLTAEEMFNAVDKNKDGMIGKEEFEHLHKVLTVRRSPVTNAHRPPAPSESPPLPSRADNRVLPSRPWWR